jgi:hypothetical protein
VEGRVATFLKLFSGCFIFEGHRVPVLSPRGDIPKVKMDSFNFRKLTGQNSPEVSAAKSERSQTGESDSFSDDGYEASRIARFSPDTLRNGQLFL